MKLSQLFEAAQPSIVALGSRVALPEPKPLFPPILGTGFVVGTDGVVATNRHVAEALQELPPVPGINEPSAFALIFTAAQRVETRFAVRALPVSILDYAAPRIRAVTKYYYGPELPDIAFLQIAIGGLPVVRLTQEPWSIKTGMDIATMGFPLGSDPLVANGVVSQVTPMLRRGIVSSLQPFSCPQPHGFTVDTASQGGQSGSPIFRTSDAAVVGMLYAGYDQTNITFAVTADFIARALQVLRERSVFKERDLPTLEEEWEQRNHVEGISWRSSPSPQ